MGPGDKVKIRTGAIDITNGRSSVAGYMYNETGPNTAVIDSITDNWYTGGLYGQPEYVTKVRCSDGNGTVVWQVQPQDIVPVNEEPPAQDPPASDGGSQGRASWVGSETRSRVSYDPGPSAYPYATDEGSSDWSGGGTSTGKRIETGSGHVYDTSTAYTSDSMFSDDAGRQTPYYKEIQVWPSEKDSTMPNSMRQLGRIYRAEYKTSWQNAGRRREMLNQDSSLIQNGEGFPTHVKGSSSSNMPDQYDYQIIPNDPRYKRVAKLEDQLMKFRAAAGLQVHGNNDIARSVKYYMYNRYKVPDTNLAHNKTFTHIFFTRPDLNLFQDTMGTKVNQQTLNHTDTALLWKTHPDLFKLLVSGHHCGDSNNFNMLLSNQIENFDIQDETLEAIDSTKSWAGHSVKYGEQYNGRTSGTFNCRFAETSDFSVYNLIKLWMTYIDNVARGAWSPDYGMGSGGRARYIADKTHVFDRALDYAASVYVFKCGPDGEEVLYWTKYYGVFPMSSGASAFNWDYNTHVGDAPKLSIQFAYTFKRDVSPISLLEFNHNAKVKGSQQWVPAFDPQAQYVGRPFVGTPYIEMDLGSTTMDFNDVRRAKKNTQIRLKFMEDKTKSRNDETLFKAPNSTSSSLNPRPGGGPTNTRPSSRDNRFM